MKIIKIIAVLILSTNVYADEIHLVNGSILHGKVIDITEKNIEYNPDNSRPFDIIAKYKVKQIINNNGDVMRINPSVNTHKRESLPKGPFVPWDNKPRLRRQDSKYGKDFRFKNLKKLNFSNKKLCYSHFTGANLQGANFVNTDIRRTVFTKANISDTDFSYADMRSSICNNLSADSSIFFSAKLSSNNMQNSNFKNTIFTKADLSFVNLNGSICNNSNFQYADLRLSKMQRAILKSANLRETNLYKANIKNSSLEDADLTDSHLEFSNLMGSNLKNAKFINCNLERTNLRATDISGADFTNANLKNAYIDAKYKKFLKTQDVKNFDSINWSDSSTEPISYFWIASAVLPFWSPSVLAGGWLSIPGGILIGAKATFALPMLLALYNLGSNSEDFTIFSTILISLTIADLIFSGIAIKKYNKRNEVLARQNTKPENFAFTLKPIKTIRDNKRDSELEGLGLAFELQF